VRRVLALILLACTAQAAPGPYARPARIAYLERALAAVRGLDIEPRRALAAELRLGARRRCRADVATPALACLLDVARATCEREPAARRPACHLVADVIVTNQQAESELVDEATRARFVARGGDYRAALDAELRVHHAELAAELALAEPGPDSDLPRRIDRFCAGPRPLAWQRCAAAIVWYIGTYGRQPATPRATP
jgi:hypothetical protein